MAILAFGTLLYPALEVAEGIDATVANMRFVKPIDENMVRSVAQHYDLLVTVEENVIMGGAGSAVAETLAKWNLHPQLLQLGLPDHFIEHGDPAALLREAGLDAQGIQASITERMQLNSGQGNQPSIRIV